MSSEAWKIFAIPRAIQTIVSNGIIQPNKAAPQIKTQRGWRNKQRRRGRGGGGIGILRRIDNTPSHWA